MPGYLLLLVLFSIFLPIAHAHDPGLSRGYVQLHESGMGIHLVFSRQDFEMLLPLQTASDGTTAMDGMVTEPGASGSILADAVRVGGAGEQYPAKSIHVETTPEDTVHVNLRYRYASTAAVQIHLPFIAQLGRGHRQYLTVRDVDGTLLAQHILDAASPPVTLQNTAYRGFSVFSQYWAEGIWHIAIGFDHILFLLTLLLPAVLTHRRSHWQACDRLRPAIIDILKVVTAFTVAHSITLTLATLELITLPSRLVEPLIALSVLITALNNLRPVFAASRVLLAFVFGLVHGMGFADVLLELGLPDQALVVSLLGFNLGVETGQLVLVALVFPVAAALRHTLLYRTWILSAGSATAAVIALLWMFERTQILEVPGF